MPVRGVSDVSLFFTVFGCLCMGACIGFFTGAWATREALEDDIASGEIKVHGRRYWVMPAGQNVFPTFANENGPFHVAHTHDPFTH